MKQLVPLLKTLYLLYFLLGGIEVYSQELREKHLKTLSNLGVRHQDFDLTREKINADFRNIIKLEKRRKSQKIAGTILLPLGMAATGLGISMISSNKNSYRRGQGDPDDPYYEEDRGLSLNSAIGSVVVVAGAAQIAVSIPMFVGSGSKKRKRNRLLSAYGVNMEGN